MTKQSFFPFDVYSSFKLGDMTAYYLVHENKIAFTLIPCGMEKEIPPHRKSLNEEIGCRNLAKAKNAQFSPVSLENMIQYHIRKDSLSSWYLPGESMIGNGSVSNMKFVLQRFENSVIETVMADDRGIKAVHTVKYRSGEPFVEVNTTIENNSGHEIILDFLASFNLGMVSPFAADDGPDRYYIHRYEAYWSAEGRHQEQTVESCALESAWVPFVGRALRFGQRTSLPVKGYFPTLGLEDRKAEVTWGVQLAALGPWQLEINRLSDFLNLSGGLPDCEFSGWNRKLKNGESFSGIPAILSCVRGDMQNALNRLTRWPELRALSHPRAELDLPVIYNEYCTTWGVPTSERLLKIADILKGHGIKYFVIDAGWFRSGDCKYPGKGDWEISTERFPDFDSYIQQIYDLGFIPGVWFEFENVNKTQSKLGETRPELVLKYHGDIYSTGNDNAPLDFRNPEVKQLMRERVIEFIRQHKIGYVKIDYNYAVIGADSSNGSSAEGLREHLDCVREFYLEIARECPELVIEICASGGHRLTAEWMRLGSMGSFSDDHEDISIPLVASGTAMQIALNRNQVWAVLRRDDDDRRLCYSLAAGFIGRLCISGDIEQLSQSQCDRMFEAVDFYREIVTLVKAGESRLDMRLTSESWNHPRGIQIFRRKNENSEMIVIHSFADAPDQIKIAIDNSMSLRRCFSEGQSVVTSTLGQITVEKFGDFNGMVILIEKKL